MSNDSAVPDLGCLAGLGWAGDKDGNPEPTTERPATRISSRVDLFLAKCRGQRFPRMHMAPCWSVFDSQIYSTRAHSLSDNIVGEASSAYSKFNEAQGQIAASEHFSTLGQLLVWCC